MFSEVVYVNLHITIIGPRGPIIKRYEQLLEVVVVKVIVAGNVVIEVIVLATTCHGVVFVFAVVKLVLVVVLKVAEAVFVFHSVLLCVTALLQYLYYTAFLPLSKKRFVKICKADLPTLLVKKGRGATDPHTIAQEDQWGIG